MITNDSQVEADPMSAVQAQLDQALNVEAAATKKMEQAHRNLSAAQGQVQALRNEMGRLTIASWGGTPDIAVLLSADDALGHPAYAEFEAWAERIGLYVPGGYYTDTSQRVIGIGVDAVAPGSVEMTLGLLDQVLPYLHEHADGRRWVHISQTEYAGCTWELRVTPGGQPNVVCVQYGMLLEEHRFDALLDALVYVREQLPCATTYCGAGDLIEHHA